MRKYFESSALVTDIVVTIFGIIILLVDIFTEPVNIPTIVFSSLLIFVGIMGVVLEGFNIKKKAYLNTEEKFNNAFKKGVFILIGAVIGTIILLITAIVLAIIP